MSSSPEPEVGNNGVCWGISDRLLFTHLNSLIGYWSVLVGAQFEHEAGPNKLDISAAVLPFFISESVDSSRYCGGLMSSIFGNILMKVFLTHGAYNHQIKLQTQFKC